MFGAKYKIKSKNLRRTAMFLSAVFCFAPVSAKEDKTKKKNNSELNLTITYNKNHAINGNWGVYEIKGADGKSIKFTQADLNGYEISEKENKLHEQIFSKECKVVYKVLDWEKALDQAKKGKYYMATYLIGKNTINIYRSSETREKINEKLSLAREKNNTDEIMACAYLLLLKQIEEEPERLESVLEHEKVHRDSDEKGINNVSTITGKQAAKLDMLDEIKATMAQVALGFEKYKITGNLEDIKSSNVGELKNFKNWLKANKDKADTEDCRLRLAKEIYISFLENNNKKGCYYYYQVMKKNHAIGRQAGAIVENSANVAEYYRRVENMFKDTSLGDVCSVINPDFKLGSGAQIETKEDVFYNMSQAEKFVYILTDNTPTVEEATECMKKMLVVVKRVDEDNIRTRYEQQKVDRAIKNVLDSKSRF